MNWLVIQAVLPFDCSIALSVSDSLNAIGFDIFEGLAIFVVG